MEMKIKELWYDENGDLIVLTVEDKMFKFTNPVITGISSGAKQKSLNDDMSIDIPFKAFKPSEKEIYTKHGIYSLYQND